MYDVIIVGARCAGASSAVLLACHGVRVLLVDRARFPSDTVSTHLLHAPGVARLKQWGLLEQLLATGCPPIETISFQPSEDLVVRGAPHPCDGVTISLAPRRIVLDALLVEAAVAAGAELREGVSLQRLLWAEGRVVGAEFADGRGKSFAERATLVVGADGRHSTVAEQVGADFVRDEGNFGCQFYGYWCGLPDQGAQIVVGGGAAVLAFPTHGGDHLVLVGWHLVLVGWHLVLVGWPRARFAEVRRDVERHFLDAVATKAPELRELLTDDARHGRIVGSGEMANYVRTSRGPGWVLVGDAAVAKDAVTAQGIGDAFDQAQLLSERLPAALAAGPAAVDAATAAYVADRDRGGAAAFATTVAFASGGSTNALLPALSAIQGRPELASMFFGIYAGRVTIEQFLAAVS